MATTPRAAGAKSGKGNSNPSRGNGRVSVGNGRVRVYEIARDVGVPSDIVLKELGSLRIPVKSHSSTVSIHEAREVKQLLNGGATKPSSRTSQATPPKTTYEFRDYLRLLRYVKPEWKSLSVVMMALFAMIALELLRPWPMKLLVDNVLRVGGKAVDPGKLASLLPGPATKEWLLFWVVAGTVILFIVLTLISILYSVVMVAMGQRMTYKLGSDLFLHMQRQSLTVHAKWPVGDSIHRVTMDPYCLQTLVNGALIPVVHSVVTLVAMMIIMLRLNSNLTLISLAVVPFIVITIRKFKDPMRERSRQIYDLEGSLMSVVQRTLTAMPVVQAFNREEQEHETFRTYADKTVKAYVRSAATDMWFNLFSGLATVLGTAIVLWLGARYVLSGTLTLGTLLVFIAYLAMLYGPLGSITYTASTFQHGAAQADRVLELLTKRPDVRDKPGAENRKLRGHVVYENVTFSYEIGHPVLTDVSLELKPGQVLAIIGATGAGKSTLVNLLVRFFDPDGGRITVDGVDIRSIKLRSLRDQVALVLQESFIFPMRIRDNIAYGAPDATLEQIRAAALAANADEFISRLPLGYETVVGERGATLSGGEKQRLSIARAFLKDAPILILDEPTSSLDARTEAMLLDALHRLMKGRVTFIIAHRLSTIRNANQIIVLDRGEIVESGSHQRLLSKNGYYATLYRYQTRRGSKLLKEDAFTRLRSPRRGRSASIGTRG